MNNDILNQNRKSWDAMSGEWSSSTTLPEWGLCVPSENELNLLGGVKNKKVLEIGCGGGFSLKWCGEHGASELFGLDISAKQLENAEKLLSESGISCTLLNRPMEDNTDIPRNYFDVAYSVYAIGWTVDLSTTFKNVCSYLKKGGIYVFSWEHPLLRVCTENDGKIIFSGDYLSDQTISFEYDNNPVTFYNRKLSTYVNTLADAGFAVERIIEQTDSATLSSSEYSSWGYQNAYSTLKAKKFPLTAIFKARKL